MNPSDRQRIDAYLRRLGRALDPLSRPERDDILQETRSHLEEAVQRGDSLQVRVAVLGPPEAYAEGFIGSSASRIRYNEVQRRGVGSVFSSIATALFTALAAALVAVAVSKLFVPTTAGLWMSRKGNLFLGVVDNPEAGRELLGFAIYPLSTVMLLGALLLLRRRAVAISNETARNDW